uniref:Uncharacterized protein n=1 Tax=Lactuca sativa TaxID=4236 RepID=A0A9R1XU72_LACSA|nr:hypothetical protein LSAT_V11C200079930 [Lactuca sativa]
MTRADPGRPLISRLLTSLNPLIILARILLEKTYSITNKMTNALFSKNKIGFVNAKIPMLEEKSVDLMNWKRSNAMFMLLRKRSRALLSMLLRLVTYGKTSKNDLEKKMHPRHMN